jgi:hypothetical protein
MLAKTALALASLAASALAAPAPLEARQSGPNYITPSAISTYDVGTGAIQCAPAGGLVAKSPSNNGHDTTTLVTFTYPPTPAGKKCAIQFYLDPAAAASGSRKIDVFTSLAPAPGCTAGWGPGNQRDRQLGRWSVAPDSWATWEWTSGEYLTGPTECKPAGTVEAFELVGVYDSDYVSWNPAVAGLRIAYV